MTVKEFLLLPKVTPYSERLIGVMQALRDSIQTTGENTQSTERRCCNKMTFQTREEALERISGYKKGSKRPFRAYQCEEGNWHLSGRPKKFIKGYYKW